MVFKNIRNALEFLKKQNKLLVVKEEVGPIYDISGIQKALEGGPALIFENIRGYPGVRNIGNLFASEEQTASLFGVQRFRQLKFRCLDTVSSPLPDGRLNVCAGLLHSNDQAFLRGSTHINIRVNPYPYPIVAPISKEPTENLAVFKQSLFILTKPVTGYNITIRQPPTHMAVSFL